MDENVKNAEEIKIEPVESAKNLGLSAPWVTYRNKLASLFVGDVTVDISPINEGTDDGHYTILIRSISEKKIAAFKKLLPETVNFGNVEVKHEYEVVPEEDTYFIAFKNLFEGSPMVSDIKYAEDMTKNQHMFLMFKPEVVQFFNDNTDDINGLYSGLAQDIAREVFASIGFQGVHFNTDRPRPAEQ